MRFQPRRLCSRAPSPPARPHPYRNRQHHHSSFPHSFITSWKTPSTARKSPRARGSFGFHTGTGSRMSPSCQQEVKDLPKHVGCRGGDAGLAKTTLDTQHSAPEQQGLIPELGTRDVPGALQDVMLVPGGSCYPQAPNHPLFL